MQSLYSRYEGVDVRLREATEIGDVMIGGQFEPGMQAAVFGVAVVVACRVKRLGRIRDVVAQVSGVAKRIDALLVSERLLQAPAEVINSPRQDTPSADLIDPILLFQPLPVLDDN